MPWQPAKEASKKITEPCIISEMSVGTYGWAKPYAYHSGQIDDDFEVVPTMDNKHTMKVTKRSYDYFVDLSKCDD